MWVDKFVKSNTSIVTFYTNNGNKYLLTVVVHGEETLPSYLLEQPNDTVHAVFMDDVVTVTGGLDDFQSIFCCTIVDFKSDEYSLD